MNPFGSQQHASDSKSAKFQTLPHGSMDNDSQLPLLSQSLNQAGHQNMYSQATRQNIKSIIQSLNNPAGQGAQADHAQAPRRPLTQLSQAQHPASFPN